MDIKKGRRKQFDIEFVVVDENNINEVAEWCGGVVSGEGRDQFIRLIDKGAMNTMQTKAFVGDVVVQHMELRTFKKFTRKTFNKSYEEIVAHGDNRDAVTGKYVTEEYAGEHPETTVKETDIRAAQAQHARKTETVELPRDADPS